MSALLGFLAKLLGGIGGWLTKPTFGRLEAWGIFRAGKGAAQSEAKDKAIADYLEAHEAVERVRRDAAALERLRSRFRKPKP